MKRWYRRPFAVSTATVTAIVLGAFLYAYVHDTMLERKFQKIKSGMSEQQVVAILGRPNHTGRCGQLGGYPTNCSHELRYDPRLPTITNYVVFVDDHGNVVDTYVYQSP